MEKEREINEIVNYVFTGNMATSSEGEMAIPLCLPNNYEWDSKKRACTKKGEERSSLYVVQEALQELRKINGK